MIERLKLWLWAWLIAKDQEWGVIVTFPTFVVLGRGKPPNPDETISSRVGRAAKHGKRWGLICEAVIDWIFARLGQEGHCRAAIEWDELSKPSGPPAP